MFVRIASYNIHQCVGLDKRSDPYRIVEVLRELDSPIVALQEVSFHRNEKSDSCYLQLFSDATGLKSFRGPTQVLGDTYYGNVLLTSYPFLDANLLDISVPGREPRGAIHAVLKTERCELQVIVTHLGLRAAERTIQIQKIMQQVSTNLPTVFAGDLNEWIPLRETMRSLSRRFGKAFAPRTFPSNFPVFALDRIWASHNNLMSSAAHVSRLSRVASDHLPVRGMIRLT